MEGNKDVPDASGEDTNEWQEAQVRFDQLKGDLDRQNGLIIGFGGLGGVSKTVGR